MQVRDYMSTKVLTIRLDKKLFAVQEIMDWAHIRHLPVVDRGNRVVGLISHRDLLRASVSSMNSRVAKVERQQHLWQVPIEPIMHAPVRTIYPDATIQEAARRMRKYRVGCLPVIEGGKLVGILTEADLLRVVAELPARAAELCGTP